MRMLLVAVLLSGCVGRGRGGDEDFLAECDDQFESTGDISQECADAANEARCSVRADEAADFVGGTCGHSEDEIRALCAAFCTGEPKVIHPCDPNSGMGPRLHECGAVIVEGQPADQGELACMALVDSCP